MSLDERYLFLDEMYTGVLLGLTQEAIRCTQSTIITKTSEERTQKTSSNQTNAAKVKHSGLKNKSNYDGERESKTKYSRVFFKDFSVPTFFSLRYRSLPDTVHEGVISRLTTDIHNNNIVVEESSSLTESRAWFDWLYENEQMVPDMRKRQSAEVVSRQEKVDYEQMTEYMNIEPRMRCHHHADSLFSTSSGFSDYHGVLNWLIVLSLCAMGRVALENIIKYGILIQPLEIWRMFTDNPYEWRCLRLTMLTNVYILMVYWMECLLSRCRISEGVGLIINTLTLMCLIIVPGAIVFTAHPSAVFSSITLVIQSIVFLKLVSYVQVNKWCRDTIKNKKTLRKRLQSTCSVAENLQTFNGTTPSTMSGISRELVSYPDNLTLSDLYYFMFAPTLCYELNFPRSERIRKRFLAKRIFEMIFFPGLIVGLVQQWIVPLVMNSRIPFQELDLGRMLERLLKLAVPNHLIWLIFFYWFFHSCLNTTAEILKFGDRVFYRDWWNAESIKMFWKNWNIPVHRWATRHVYKPLVCSGYSPSAAGVVVFFISAFFHEYLVSVPLRMFRLWAFMGMLGQIPLAYLTQCMDQKLGNMIVWLSLVIGQPIAVLMYYHDYYLMNN
ncbi:hypothetical protein LSH36_750g00044 [Paralvinella palmiformis]|uniref:O-acyltransferase n=1 Tax=Paralvinella palmiformis TaxID=53620 RepID=A0AAD9J1P0_9ANNE|nr:hypothetical protein LSH36_750g00044 [Paralvinella palmiformis]